MNIKKIEKLLLNYNKYLKAINVNPNNTIITQNLVKVLKTALDSISDDFYYEIIEMIYFKHMTREEIAEYYDVDVKTISRNKIRLLNEMNLIVFSDKNIKNIMRGK